MAIIFPRPLLTTPGINSYRFRPLFNNTTFTSPIVKTSQTIKRPGNRWAGFYSFAPKKTDDVRALKAWILSMEGDIGTFLGFDPTGRMPIGIADGGLDTPQIKGAGQQGGSILTDGWRINQTGLLLPGDYVQFGDSGLVRQLKQVKEQVDSNGIGEATINFGPDLHISPTDNDPVVFENPVGIFKFLNPDDVGWESSVDEFHKFAFAFIEVPQTA